MLHIHVKERSKQKKEASLHHAHESTAWYYDTNGESSRFCLFLPILGQLFRILESNINERLRFLDQYNECPHKKRWIIRKFAGLIVSLFYGIDCFPFSFHFLPRLLIGD